MHTERTRRSFVGLALVALTFGFLATRMPGQVARQTVDDAIEGVQAAALSVHGDVATASITVNSIPKILEVAPGLHTMRDMPLPSFFGGQR